MLTALTGAMILAMAGAAMATEETYFIINDHLGTPQVIEDANGTVVWKADYEPYGAATVNEDPDGDGKKVVCNLRFPGQHYDAETGWSYNWHRYYDQELGRYLQADPVGLSDELSLYSYANNNVLSLVDPTGRNTQVIRSVITWALPSIGTIFYFPMPECPDMPCPPCKTISGRVVPVGSIAYRTLDIQPEGDVQHGIQGPHYNLYRANQSPRNSLMPCKCFWQSIGAVSSSKLPVGAIPIEPFVD